MTGGAVALDATEVHPEDYPTATALLSAARLPTATLAFGADAAAQRKAALESVAADALPEGLRGVAAETVCSSRSLARNSINS